MQYIRFVGADLHALVQESAMSAIKQAYTDHTTRAISMSHFTQSMAKIVPSSKRGAQVKVTPTEWKDIGGLNDVKEALQQVGMVWHVPNLINR